MDADQIASVKMERLAKPIQRTITVVAPSVPKAESPAPIMTQADPVQPGADVSVSDEERADGASLIPQDDYLTSPMFHELAQFFNVEPKFYESMKDKISVVTDWAIIKANSNKIEDIFHTIRNLEDNLYKPGWDETRLDVLYKYLRIASGRDAANKALRAFERGPMPDGNSNR